MPVLGETMSEGAELARFSHKGDLLAVSSPDGRLTLWSGGEGAGSRLEQQLVPSTHLEAVTTCLSWAPSSTSPPSGKRKKKKSRDGSEGGGGDLVALGTAAGSLLVYSTTQGELVTVLKAEGLPSIYSLVWTNSGASIFAAGEEGKVAEFSVVKQKLLSIFKASPDPIHCLALSPDDSTLVVAGLDIKLFELPSRSLLKTFTGHSTPVNCLSVFANRVFSCGQGERTVALWRLEGEETAMEKALAINDSVSMLDIVEEEEGEEAVVAVVTAAGMLKLYKPKLETGKKQKKPLKPWKSLTVAAEKKDAKGRVAQIPIVAARLNKQNGVAVGFGLAVRPMLERLQLEDMETSHCLVRSNEVSKDAQEEEFSRTVTPKTDGAVTFLAPGVSLPVGTGKLGKRKQAAKKEGEESLPMEDRLALLSTVDGSKTPPRTDTLAQLLAQGLHSNDQRILSSVLDRADPDLIDNTVRRVPAEAIVPLVQTLMRFIKGRGRVDASHAKWLRSVLGLHTGYLVSVPECQDLLSPVFALLEARTQHYSQVLQLRGKLELLTKQTEATGGEADIDAGKEALLVYQDDSSDEMEDVMNDLLVPASDTDDDFDEEDGDETMEASKLDSDSDVEIVNGDEEMESEEDD